MVSVEQWCRGWAVSAGQGPRSGTAAGLLDSRARALARGQHADTALYSSTFYSSTFSHPYSHSYSSSDRSLHVHLVRAPASKAAAETAQCAALIPNH